MWGSWSKSSPKISSSSSSSSTSTSTSTTTTTSDIDKDKNKQQQKIFRCSSFKDIENLCLDHPDFSDFNLSISTPTANSNAYSNTNAKPTDNLKRQPSTPSRRSVFHRVRTANALLRQWPGRSEPPKSDPQAPDARIVVYYTSLRVVRPTFEACRAVQSILQGFRVAIDERDLAMDSSFMSELRELLGVKKSSEKLTLPRVFIGGRYIGGADEIKQLHEIGELKKLISGLPLAKPGTCPTCGGYRFILCGECSGSHKIFNEKTTGFRSCATCNENGLIKCPDCSSPPPLSRPILAPRIVS